VIVSVGLRRHRRAFARGLHLKMARDSIVLAVAGAVRFLGVGSVLLTKATRIVQS
jgi:hypothetical protein